VISELRLTRWEVTPGSNTVLVMTSSARTSTLLSDYLNNLDSSAPPGQQGRKLLERKLKLYLWWKRKLAEDKQEGGRGFAMPSRNKDFEISAPNSSSAASGGLSEALKRKDQQAKERQASRRRTRGGGPVAVVKSDRATSVAPQGEQESENAVLREAEDITDL
jgi:DNA excision repair protein ERCC-4